MWRLRQSLMRVFSFLRVRNTERELDREVRAHLALLADDYENRGMSPAEARTAARRALGGVEQTKELHRDQRSFPLVNSVWQDLRYAGRTLSQAPGFSLSVIASLSIGMAAVVAAVAFINGVMFHPYPGIDERDRLVELRMLRGTRVPGYWSANRIAMSDYPENYRILRDGLRSLENLASYVGGDVSATLSQPTVLRSVLVSANYFDVLDIGPEIGRFFAPEEDELTNAYVAVIGHNLWVREFGGDPGAIGRLITVADQNVEIVGVAPDGFAGAGYSFGRPGYEVWLPIPLTELVLKDVPSVVRGQQPGDREIQYIGRMKDGVEVPLVQAELDVVAPQTATIGFRPGPVMGEASILSMIHPSDGALLTALILSIPILVLIIGCINAANLLLARASRRDREMAIRLAVGASRWRLIRQLIVESLVLALGAAAVALPLAWWGLQFATPFLLVPMPLDAAVLAAALGTAVVTAIVFGLIPALRATTHRPAAQLSASRAGIGPAPGQSRGRRALVAVQVALSLGLLATGTQLVSALKAVGGTAGIDSDRLLMVSFDLEQLRFSSVEADAFYERLLDRVSTLPGVEAAGLAHRTMLWKFGVGGLVLKNSVAAWRPADRPEDARVYSGGYTAGDLTEVLGLGLLEGRVFTQEDREGTPKVAILTEPLASQLFDGPAVGQILSVSTRDQDAQSVRIVGVVEAPRDPHYRRDGDGSVPAVFLPSLLQEQPARTLYVRSRGPALALAPVVRDVVDGIDPRVPLLEAASLEQLNREDLGPQRGLAQVAAFLGVVAMFLATLGLYGVTSYLVSMRSREIAVRVAFGARPGSLMAMVFRQGLTMAAIGVVFGSVAAIAVGVWIQAEVLGAAGVDAATLAGSAALLTIAMLVASAIPARRAARLDPMHVLRSD